MDKTVKIKIVGDFNSTSETLRNYFSSFLHCGIPSSMPCPYCGKIMVRPDRCKKERMPFHPLMGVVNTEEQKTVILCEECYKRNFMLKEKDQTSL